MKIRLCFQPSAVGPRVGVPLCARGAWVSRDVTVITRSHERSCSASREENGELGIVAKL